jgi:outer membrane protein assembly factor BamB
MNAPNRGGRWSFWVINGLLFILAGLFYVKGSQQPFDQDRFEADPALLEQLQRATLGTAATPAGATGDWPQWRGPQRDGVSGEKLPASWPAQGPRVAWQTSVGGGYSCMAVVGQRLVTLEQDGDCEAVVCRNSETGKEQWRFRYPDLYSCEHGAGPRSTPTVDSGLVYTVGATGTFHCLKLDSGEKVWRHDLLDEFKAPNRGWGLSFSPLVEGDLVFTNPGGPGGAALAAFDKRSGQLVWKTGDDPGGYSSPVVSLAGGVRQVLFFTGTRLVSVAPADGKELWSFPWETVDGCNIATPIVLGDYVFISSGYGRGCALLKVEADQGQLHAQQVYANNRMRNHFSTCVYYRDYLYGFNDAVLTCMELRTGKVAWRHHGFQKGSLMLADGRLIVLGEDGKLSLVEATPQEFREQATGQPLEGKCWTMPVLSRGRLYLRNQEQMLCLELAP